jgi:hypothetical protein
VGLNYFSRASTLFSIACHRKVKPLIANGRIAKNATRCRGFFQQKQPVTGQDLTVVLLVARVESPFEN